MRRVMSSSRKLISASSDSPSSSIGSGAARLLDLWGVGPGVKDKNVGLGELVSGEDARVDEGRVGGLSSPSSCCRVAMISSAMLGRLILRLRRRRDAITLGAGEELAIVLIPSAMESYAGGGSE